MLKSNTKLENIKAIYFDLDNTLINRNAAFEECIASFFDKKMSDFNYDKEKEIIQKKDDWGYTSRVDFCRWFIDEYEPKDYTVDDFWQYQKKTISQYVQPVSKEILDVLNELKEKYIIGVLTNGSVSNQRKKLSKSGLLDLFDSNNIHISAQYQLSKPNPKLFQIILNQHKLKSDELLYVGDDPINDIWGAGQLGVQTCWISHGRIWKEIFLSDFECKNVFSLPVV